MRKTGATLGMIAVIFFACAASAATVSWSWDTTGDLEGWSDWMGGSATLSADGGALVMTYPASPTAVSCYGVAATVPVENKYCVLQLELSQPGWANAWATYTNYREGEDATTAMNILHFYAPGVDNPLKSYFNPTKAGVQTIVYNMEELQRWAPPGTWEGADHILFEMLWMDGKTIANWGDTWLKVHSIEFRDAFPSDALPAVWQNDWSQAFLHPSNVSKTLDNSGSELTVSYTGAGFGGEDDVIFQQLTMAHPQEPWRSAGHPIIPKEKKWMRMEITLDNWDTALAAESYVYRTDAGEDEHHIMCPLRFKNYTANDTYQSMWMYVDPTLSGSKQTIIVDVTTLTGWGTASNWTTADITSIAFMFPWPSEGAHTAAAWNSSVGFSISYMGFFATEQEAIDTNGGVGEGEGEGEGEEGEGEGEGEETPMPVAGLLGVGLLAGMLALSGARHTVRRNK